MRNKEIETEFVIYPLALRMKNIGFDEPCVARYYTKDSTAPIFMQWTKKEGTKFNSILLPIGINNEKTSPLISAPTWQSAFAWLIPQINDEYKVSFRKEGWYIYDLDNKQFEGSERFDNK